MPSTPRRSSRVRHAIPVLVTSLEPGTHFSGVCETLVVNAHGCAMRSPVKFKTGIPLHLHSKDGRQATAQVVSCQPIGPDGQNWKLGARLDRPQNFWGLQNCPIDWAALPPAPTPPTLPGTLATTSQLARQVSVPLSSEVVPADAVRQAAEEHIRRVINESVRPLQSEIMALKEKLARGDANRSRFEVSLSNIPPELEQQLESRLRTALGPRVVDEARQQSAQLLTAAQLTIDQKTSAAYETFCGRLAEEFQVFQQRAQDVSAHISEDIREHVRGGLGEFQQRLVDGGSRLKRMSEQLLEFLQHNLEEQHNGRSLELEQLRAAVAADSSRLQEQIAYLDQRITTLYESACRLESGVEKRLAQMASDVVRDARSELENAASSTLLELTTRNVQALEKQTHAACEDMQRVEKEIIASFSRALEAQVTKALQNFEHSMEELAKHSVERWRLTLASGFDAMVKSLGEQFQLKANSGAAAGEY